MQKEKIKKYIRKIIVFILFLIASFLLALIIYLLIFGHQKISPLFYTFGDNYIVKYSYFLFIFSIFYLIFELINHFLKKRIVVFTFLSLFVILFPLMFISKKLNAEILFAYLLITISSVVLAGWSFQQLTNNISIKIKTTVSIIFIMIFVTIHLIFPGYGKKILEHNIREGSLCSYNNSKSVCSNLTLNEYFPYYGCEVIRSTCTENKRTSCGLGGCSDNITCYYLCPSSHIPEWHSPLKNK